MAFLAPTMHDNTPFFIVLNGGSGQQTVDADEATIKEICAAAGRHCELAVAGAPGELEKHTAHMANRAREEQGVLVAAGGDGTLRTVAQLAVEQQLLFGVLPAGTFNFFGRSYGIPTDIAEATRTLVAAVERPVQVGLVNGRVFLVNASVGLYPELLEDREAFKKRFGRTRFVAMCAGLATLFRDHRLLLLEYDHQGEKRIAATSTLFVGNSRLQLEQVGIEEATVVRQGQLAAVVVGDVGKLGFARAAIRGALGSLGDAEGVDSFSFTQLVVKLRSSRNRLIKVATDGEIAMLSSLLTFTVEPRTLRLLRLPATPREAAR